MQILIIEDEQPVAALIRSSLEAEGYSCTVAHDGVRGLELFNKHQPDLVILDWNLPFLAGIDVCEKIRQQAHSDPLIMMLTGKGAEGDRITGYAVGVDDYFTKPFSPSELVVRVRALSRRSLRLNTSHAVIETSHFVIDPARREVRLRHQPQEEYQAILLSPVEFDLLHALSLKPRMVFTRSQLLDVVKGQEFVGDTRAIDTYIKRVRDKTSSSTEREKFIKTHHGVGYSFEDPGFPQ